MWVYVCNKQLEIISRKLFVGKINSFLILIANTASGNMFLFFFSLTHTRSWKIASLAFLNVHVYV